MKTNEEYNNFNFKENDNSYKLSENSLITDSENEEYFKKNYETEKINSKNKYVPISNTLKPKIKDIYNMERINNNFCQINYNNHDNTIPISKKNERPEIQNIDKILRYLNLKEDNKLIKNKYSFNSFNNGNNTYNKEQIGNNMNMNMESIEELEKKKEILISKLKKIKQKNKELMSYLEPYKQSMTNEDIENEQRIKYIKYLVDRQKEYIYINNKLKHKLKNNQNISIKKKVEYLINKQIKEYEKIYKDINNNNDSLTNDNFNEIKNKNIIYTHNNINAKCELSLSGGNSNSEYKLNNATTDGLINSKHKIINNENLNNKNNRTKKNTNTNVNSHKLNKNNSLIFGGENKNKNNNSLKFKKNNSKSNFLSSIKYINSKITRNSNTSSSITSSHDNNNINNNLNKKNDFKNLKQNTKITNGLNFRKK